MLALIVVVLAATACSPATADVAATAPLVETPPQEASPALPTTAAFITVAPSESAPSTTPSPTIAAPPTSTPTVAATASPPPSATPPDPAAGLPCPAEPPIKPDYERGGVGATPLEPGDVGGTSLHQSLAGPVPVEGLPRVNRNFPYGSDSNGRYLLHNGLDIVEPPGEPVVAVASGTVIVAGTDAERLFGWRCDWYGNLVVLQLDEELDGQPVFVLYGHVVDISVQPGDRVRTGDTLAAIGVGGVSTAPHLHLEVRIGRNEFGATRNPDLWLETVPGYGTIAGRLVDPDGLPWQGVTVTLIDSTGQSNFVHAWTYLDDPDHLIHSDEALGENFTFGFVPEGDYVIYAQVQGQEYRQPVTVISGEIALVEIVTQPFQTPTPSLAPSAVP